MIKYIVSELKKEVKIPRLILGLMHLVITLQGVNILLGGLI